MKRKNFFTGSVFQFYVPQIRKYAFCKYFDFKHLSSFHGLLAQVFDHFSDNKENKIEILTDVDWLFGARSMHMWPSFGKNTGWQSLGLLQGPDDGIVPDFKETMAFLVEDDRQIKEWIAIHNLTEIEECNYEQVNHLERRTLTTSGLGLVWRTGMEYCRINGLDVEKYFDLTQIGMRNTYLQMINVPIYSTIPKGIRGKSLKRAASK